MVPGQAVPSALAASGDAAVSIHRHALTLALLVGSAAALGGCNAGGRLPEPVAAVAPPVPVVADAPAGKGCAPVIAHTRALVESDVATGNLDGSVGKRFDADLGQAASACAAGRDGEGLRLLAAAKTRYGYR